MDKQLKFNVTSNTKGLDDIDNKVRTTGKTIENVFTKSNAVAKKLNLAFNKSGNLAVKTAKVTKAGISNINKTQKESKVILDSWINSAKEKLNIETKTAKAISETNNVVKKSKLDKVILDNKTLRKELIKTTKETTKQASALKKLSTPKKIDPMTDIYKEVSAKPIQSVKDQKAEENAQDKLMSKTHTAANKINTQYDKDAKTKFNNMHKEAILTEKQIQKQKELVRLSEAKNLSLGLSRGLDDYSKGQTERGKDIATGIQEKQTDKSISADTSRMKKLGIDTQQYDAILKSLNMTRDKSSNLIDKTSKKLITQGTATQQISTRFQQLNGVMEGTKRTQLPMDQLENKMGSIGITMNKTGGFYDSINKKGIKQHEVVEKLNRKYQQFNMNALGIMFFGMSIARTFDMMLQPAMANAGVMESWSAMMADFFAPAAERASWVVDGLTTQLDKTSERTKELVGGLALAGSGFGHAFSMAGQYGLGINALRTEIPIFITWLKSFNVVQALSSKQTNLNTIATNSNKKSILTKNLVLVSSTLKQKANAVWLSITTVAVNLHSLSISKNRNEIIKQTLATQLNSFWTSISVFATSVYTIVTDANTYSIIKQNIVIAAQTALVKLNSLWIAITTGLKTLYTIATEGSTGAIILENAAKVIQITKTKLSAVWTAVGTVLTKLHTTAVKKNAIMTTATLVPALAKGAAASKSAGLASLTMILPLLLIIAAVVLLASAWKGNWGGIRQKTGDVLIWFSGVYDKYLKPVFSLMGNGVIFIANLFIYSFSNLGTKLELIMLGIQLVQNTFWNGLLAVVQWGVNNLIKLITLPLALYNAMAEEKGWTQIEIPEMDLSAYMTSSDALISEGARLATVLDTSWDNMLTNTSASVLKYNNFLDSGTEGLIGAGIGAIESGERFDMAKAQEVKTPTINNNNYTTEINISEAGEDIDIEELTRKINESLGKSTEQGWNQ